MITGCFSLMTMMDEGRFNSLPWNVDPERGKLEGKKNPDIVSSLTCPMIVLISYLEPFKE
jgi:hypothetical protein